MGGVGSIRANQRERQPKGWTIKKKEAPITGDQRLLYQVSKRRGPDRS
jgi:hypothetical protein